MKSLFRGQSAVHINHLFQTLLVTYLVLLLFEQLWSGVVSFYLNLNYLLVVVVFVGLLDVFSLKPASVSRSVSRFDYLFVLGLGIVGFFVVLVRTMSLGWLSWVVSFVSLLLIVLLGWLVLEDDDSDSKPKKRYRYELTRDGKLFVGVVGFVFLLLCAFLFGLFSGSGFVSGLRVVFGGLFVLFIPGFVCSKIFFPGRSIGFVERVALSFALSVAVVPLVVFYVGLFGIPISSYTVILVVLVLVLLGLGIISRRSKRSK